MTYIKGIDTLRAFAVISVMLYHLNPTFLKGGFTGVDVFFVISGYVVSGSLQRIYTKNFFYFIINFYAKRVKRIIPALLFFLFIASLFTTLFIPFSWLSGTTPKTALSAFFGYSNLVLVWYNDGYFAPRVEFNTFAHTWSLGVEEQFYLLFPLLFYFWNKTKKTTIFVVLTFLSSLIYSAYMTHAQPTHAFYFLPSRFWELLAGAILFKLHHQDIKLPSLSLYVGLFLLLLGFLLANSNSFPFPWALLPVSGTLIAINALVSNQKQLVNPLLIHIGKISYSLYLWHWGVYVLLRWTIGLQSYFQMLLAIVLTFVLATFSYHYIENPIRTNNYLLKRQNYFTVILAVLVIFALQSATKQIFKSQPQISQSVTKNRYIWYANAYPSKKHYKTVSLLKKHKLFVFGDSHAFAYSTMLQMLQDQYGIKIYKFSSGNCPVADLIHSSASKSKDCKAYIQKVLSRIKNLSSPGDTIFLASLRSNRLSDQWALFERSEANRNTIDKKALPEARELLKKLFKLNLHIIIDTPKPIFKAPLFRCSDWFNKNNPICLSGFTMKKEFLKQRNKEVLYSIAQLKQEFPKLIIYDPFPALCPQTICNAYDGKKPLFFDADHLSAHGNRVLYPEFSKLIRSIYDIQYR